MPRLYNFCWYFLIFSVVGWTIESALVSCQQKKFVNRGFLAGPVCPIYGTAMCIIVAALAPVKQALLPNGFGAEGSGGLSTLSVFILLLVSAVIACVVEYIVGWFLEKMFHQRWWDYSDHRFNLNGRIAVPESLAWGPLATLAILFAIPWLDSLIARIPQPVGYGILGTVAAVMLFDVVRILNKMKVFDKLAAAIRDGRRGLDAWLETERRRKSDKQRARRERRIRRSRRLLRRLTAAYPKLGEKWRAIREEDKRQDENKD